MASPAGGGFLRPSKEEQQTLKAKREEVARVAKADAKVKAAKRKRERDEAKARVAVIEEEIKSGRAARISCEHCCIDAIAEDKVRTYLDNPPFYGRSKIEDKDRVKQLCGEAHERRWDKERKLWGTKVVGHVERLVNSGKWMPFGMNDEWIPYLLVKANQRTEDASAHAEAVANVKHETSAEAIAAASATNGETGHLNIEQRAAASQAASQQREVDEMMLAATEAEVAACARFGFAEATVYQSRFWPELGPRAGLSDEGRLLRWMSIEESNVRCDYEQPPWVHEYYFDESKMRPIVDAKLVTVVAAMNVRAGELASSGR